jgi:hypothetical protein
MFAQVPYSRPRAGWLLFPYHTILLEAVVDKASAEPIQLFRSIEHYLKTLFLVLKFSAQSESGIL